VYVRLGYVLYDQLAYAAHVAKRLGGGAIVIAVGAVVIYLGIKVTRRQLFLRQLRIARITAEQLEAELRAGEPVFIADLRHDLDVQAQPTMIRGAVRIAPAALEKGEVKIPRDRDVVLYCSWPNEATSARVALLLRRRGVSRIRPLAGGFEGWRALGFPLEPVAGLPSRVLVS
jgi:rhodanese-related sulfurtransferase